MSNEQQKFGIKHGEEPRTTFVDSIEAVKVQLVDWPDVDRLCRAIINMAHASWYENAERELTPEEYSVAIDNVLAGNTLGQAVEHAHFLFRVSGLNLHGTHSLVRNRIGIAYMQRSLAVSDLRHEPILVPRAFQKTPELLQQYYEWCQEGKRIYAAMLDSGEIGQLDARLALPKTIPSWIYVSVSLVTLLSVYAKRTDTQEEPPELNVMCEQMKNAVSSIFPFLRAKFVSACDAGKCLHQRPGYTANCIYARDEKHKCEEVNAFTLHDKTRTQLHLFDTDGVTPLRPISTWEDTI